MSDRGQDYARSIARIAERSIGKPLRTLLSTALILALGLYLLTKLDVDPSPEVLLQGAPAWTFYAQLDQAYEIGETVVVALRERGGTVFDVETVSAVAELDRVLHEMPEVERVLSLATATTLARRGDVVDLRPILESEALTAHTALDLGRRIREHPVYSQVLVDARHETTFLFVQLPTYRDPVRRMTTVQTIIDEVDRFRSNHRTVHLAGSPILKHAIGKNFVHDIELFLPAALALLAVLLWFAFGDVFASFGPIAVAGGATAIALGALGAAGERLDFATVHVPAVVVSFAVVESVHFFVELRRQHARIGATRASLLATVEALALPMALTCASATVALLALVTSGIGSLANVGWSGALGTAAVYPLVLWVLPTALHRVGHPSRRVRLFPAARMLGERVGQLAMRAKQRSFMTLAVTGLLMGCGVAVLAGVSIDSDFAALLPPEDRLERDIAIIEKTLGGTDVVEVILDADEPGRFKTPPGLQLLDSLARDLRNFDGVSRVFGLADYLRLANAVMNDAIVGAEAPLPSTAEAIAQLELLDPIAFATLASDNQGQARLTMQVKTMSSQDVLRLIELAEQAAAINLKDTDVQATFTGLPALFAGALERLARELPSRFGLGLVLMFVLLSATLRRPALAAAALSTVVLTVGLTVATTALFGVPFDSSSVLVATLGVTVVASHAVHITARYQRGREEGAPDKQAALHYALTNAGHPVVLSSVILAVSLAVVCLSSFTPTFRVGLLSATLLAYAVLLDLILLPVLLLATDRA